MSAGIIAENLYGPLGKWRNGDEDDGCMVQMGKRFLTELAIPILSVVALVESVARALFGLLVLIPLGTLIANKKIVETGVKEILPLALTPVMFTSIISNIYLPEL